MNEEQKTWLKEKLTHGATRVGVSLKWVVFSLLSGLSIGALSSLFCLALSVVTDLRGQYPSLVLLLPAGGLFIVFLYRILHDEEDTGTNLVLSAIQSGERVPLRMAPAIFLSTLATHLFGGSAGREGAALQFGGSLGGQLGRLLRLDEKDQHIMIMCGMSAAFSALFGTPMAAAIFSMEVVSVGIMHYSALLPCVIASLTARRISRLFGLGAEAFDPGAIPPFSLRTALACGCLAALSAAVSVLFCVCLHQSAHLFKDGIKNPWLRIMAGGAAVTALTLLLRNQDYNGAGIPLIETAFTEGARPYDFLLKILFTALTIGAGYKGGEIVPSFCVGACFGSLLSGVLGLGTGLSAAIGMISVFCGVTNCPVTSLLISFELFGYQGMPYYLLSVALSYVLSGYYGLYQSQRIVYSKYKTRFINRRTH